MDKISNELTTKIIDNFYLILEENDSSFKEAYAADSFLLTQEGELVKGDEIVDYYTNTVLLDTRFDKNNVVSRCFSETGIYEIVDIMYQNGEIYSVLTHWICKDNKPIREYEILTKKEKNNIDLIDIDNQRELFCQIINKEHDVNKLLNQVYDKNPIYFNNGRLINTKDKLLSEYSYMSDASFDINLIKTVVYPVNSSSILEIGEWQSRGYSGKYVLFWKKTENVWKIAFDSN